MSRLVYDLFESVLISSELFKNVSNSSWDCKIYCQFLIQKQYIPTNRKYPVFLMVVNCYNRHRRLLICYWTGGLPRLGHNLVSPSFYHQMVYLNWDMFLANKWRRNCKVIYAFRSKTLIKLCVTILFKFQWQIENSWQRLDWGPGFVSTSPLRIIFLMKNQRKFMKPSNLIIKRMQLNGKYKVFCELYQLKGHPKMLVNQVLHG